VSPFDIQFQEASNSWEITYSTEENSLELAEFVVFLEFIFGFRMFMTCFTTYTDIEEIKVQSVKMIFTHYLQTSFMIDIIALLPL
jgi:hypothetical protein